MVIEDSGVQNYSILVAIPAGITCTNFPKYTKPPKPTKMTHICNINLGMGISYMYQLQFLSKKTHLKMSANNRHILEPSVC